MSPFNSIDLSFASLDAANAGVPWAKVLSGGLIAITFSAPFLTLASPATPIALAAAFAVGCLLSAIYRISRSAQIERIAVQLPQPLSQSAKLALTAFDLVWLFGTLSFGKFHFAAACLFLVLFPLFPVGRFVYSSNAP